MFQYWSLALCYVIGTCLLYVSKLINSSIQRIKTSVQVKLKLLENIFWSMHQSTSYNIPLHYIVNNFITEHSLQIGRNIIDTL